jgi:hypothetical protein
LEFGLIYRVISRTWCNFVQSLLRKLRIIWKILFLRYQSKYLANYFFFLNQPYLYQDHLHVSYGGIPWLRLFFLSVFLSKTKGLIRTWFKLQDLSRLKQVFRLAMHVSEASKQQGPFPIDRSKPFRNLYQRTVS